MFLKITQTLRNRKGPISLNLSLLILDGGIVAWLMVSQRLFLGLPVLSGWQQSCTCFILAALAWLCGLNRDWINQGGRFALNALLFYLLTATILPLLPGNDHTWSLRGISNWLAVAATVSCITARAIFWKIQEKAQPLPLETSRWIIICIAATWAVHPVYGIKPSGAGDAYWYTIMLADYLEQLRAGVFPVWLGQSEYAFNGAFFPLRIAPGFQHLGGIIDQLSLHSLDYIAVKNVAIALSSLASGFFSYFCLRAMSPSRPNLAIALALLYLFSPGLITPWIIGDQYMTFLAAPYIPIVFYSCWRAFIKNDAEGHIYLGASTASLWLFHTPVALWTSLFAAGLYIIKLIIQLRSGRELKMMGIGFITYILLGTYPIFSALSINNMVKLSVDGASIFNESQKIFPDILFRTIASGYGPFNYQPGYATLAVGLTGFVLAILKRNFAALAFASASLFITVFILPIPTISPWIWSHIPQFILNATNTWAAQRLALIWVGLLIFTLASALAVIPVKPRSKILRLGLVLLFVGAIGWSIREASALHTYIIRTIPNGPSTGWKILYEKHNLILSRYAYSFFQKTPPYFSHDYMDPRLENRLLSREDKLVFLSNYDSAASASASKDRTLISSGLLRAYNDNNSVFYLLKPAPTIESGKHYALRLDFLKQDETGTLQVMGDQLFREYTLPDSGAGMGAQVGLPQSFGTTPTSSHVIPLYTHALITSPLHITQILPDKPKIPEFDCAHFQLWEYNPSRLPINILSLVPYRARVDSPKQAYLETPRMWLKGYSAKTNGKALSVLPSPSNLCMIPLEAGISEIELNYTPPLYIATSYWIGIFSWGSIFVLFVASLFLRRKHVMGMDL